MSHGNNGNNNEINHSTSPAAPEDKCPVDHGSRQAWSGLTSGPLYNPHMHKTMGDNAVSKFSGVSHISDDFWSV